MIISGPNDLACLRQYFLPQKFHGAKLVFILLQPSIIH